MITKLQFCHGGCTYVHFALIVQLTVGDHWPSGCSNLASVVLGV